MSVEAIAKNFGLESDQAALELMQTRILSALFRNVVNKEMVVKGGFAMRLAANSFRNTKDIDLQANNGISSDRVRSLVRSAIKEIEKSHLLDGFSVSEPKQTDTTQRWKINGRIAGGETPVHLTIEVSRRGDLDPNFVQGIHFEPGPLYGAPPVIVETLTPTAIAAGKFEALSSLTRESPRDVYDLFILSRMKVAPPTSLFANKYTPEVLEEKLRVITDKLDKMDFAMAKDHLLPAMPPEIRMRFGKEEWETMRINTYLMLENWVTHAKQLQQSGTDNNLENAQSSVRM